MLDADFSADAGGKSNIENSVTYTGRRFDEESGLYYFRHRYHHPQLGHFTNRDPAGYVDGMSLYQSYFAPGGLDPSGLRDWLDPVIDFGAGFGNTITFGAAGWVGGVFADDSTSSGQMMSFGGSLKTDIARNRGRRNRLMNLDLMPPDESKSKHVWELVSGGLKHTNTVDEATTNALKAPIGCTMDAASTIAGAGVVGRFGRGKLSRSFCPGTSLKNKSGSLGDMARKSRGLYDDFSEIGEKISQKQMRHIAGRKEYRGGDFLIVSKIVRK